MTAQKCGKIRLFFIGLGFALFSLSSCSSNKYLLEGESFLYSNDIRIRSDHRIRNKGVLKSELEARYQQPATRTVIGIPRHWFYYQTRNNPDSVWFKSWVRKSFASEPVIYDSTLAEKTTEVMTHHLRERGYWDAGVTFQASEDRRRTSVVYTADPMQRWTVASIRYHSPDTTIQKILDSLTRNSLLSPGQPVDVNLYKREKLRITQAMQNLGYANFFTEYIGPPLSDSSDHEMALQIEVRNPPEGGRHRVFTIGEITVYPDYSNQAPNDFDTVAAGIRFLSPENRILVKPGIILRNIYLVEGERYSREDYDKTLRQLSKLETYRFINIKSSEVPDTNVLNYDIYLTRNKKMSIGGEIEINYSTLQSRRSLMGLGLNVNYRNRNFLRGAELFTTGLETGIEVNLRDPDNRLNTVNINWQNSLYIPRFIDPLRFYTLLNKIRIGKNGIMGDKLYEWLQEGSSKVNLGFQFLSLSSLYSYQSLNASLGYDVQPDNKRRLQWTHIGVDFFSPDTRPAFDTILNQNPFLRESFGRQLFTGFLFRDYQFTYNSGSRWRGFSYAIIHSGEISGLEVYGINTLYNKITGRTGNFSVGSANPLEFSHFGKFEIETRLNRRLSSRQQLAMRIATGIAFPYGGFSTQVPFVKQFYIGGPQSLRAWQIRELGPGGYDDPNVEEDRSLPFYQTGDVKIEASLEYRFDIAWIFEGALFADAGNIWTLKEDPDRPGAAISSDFINQIAVGTGFGLRLDFTYFLIRLDLGYKLRNPFPDEEGRYWLFHRFRDFSLRQFNTNFAIGYPF